MNFKKAMKSFTSNRPCVKMQFTGTEASYHYSGAVLFQERREIYNVFYFKVLL